MWTLLLAIKNRGRKNGIEKKVILQRIQSKSGIKSTQRTIAQLLKIECQNTFGKEQTRGCNRCLVSTGREHMVRLILAHGRGYITTGLYFLFFFRLESIVVYELKELMCPTSSFPTDLILTAVGWYLRSNLSCRDVEELMAERGIVVDQSTINRWVVKYAS
jgi:hypothetical protein